MIPPLTNNHIPHALEDRQAAHNHTRVIHRRCIKRHRVRETVDDDPHAHVRTRDTRDRVEDIRGHRERAADDVRPARQDVGQDEGQVRARAHDDEGADERGKRGAVADVDSAEHRVHQRAGEGRVERVLLRAVHAAQPGAEGCGGVAAERPEHAAGGDVGADVGAECGQVDDDEEAEGASKGVCGLAVEFGEGEGPGVGKEGVEVVDTVEDGDYIEEGGKEANDVLREDGFGNVDARLGDFLCKMRDAVTENVSTGVVWS